ncbi:MAG TPA: MFS transporter [Actinomycetota bacterium]|jgi:MFS family permease|nr:MFS transporter [Actinomycetota bacterium]
MNDDLGADLRRILGIQAVRAFLYGFGAVILGASLAASGTSDLAVGILGAAILAGMAISAITVGILGDRWGRRRTYGGLLLLMGVVGAAYAATDKLWILIVLALIGVLSTDANENGPLTTLEQAMIGQAPAETRLRVFGRYNAVAYLAGAFGALLAGGPAFVHRFWNGTPTGRAWFLLFPIGAVICLWLASGLSAGLETEVARSRIPLERSRATVTKLSSLFAVDAFAGGFVVTVIIVFWFSKKFDASPELMSAVIFLAGLLQAGSSVIAPRIAARAGMLNTMVFTHLPSNILLMLVPFMPTLGSAIAVLLGRFALSQMDVPTRQAYIAAMVDPSERTAAAAATNSARYVARPAGPIIGTVLMRVAFGAPWVVAGAIKCGYDVALWRVFSKVPLPESAAD